MAGSSAEEGRDAASLQLERTQESADKAIIPEPNAWIEQIQKAGAGHRQDDCRNLLRFAGSPFFNTRVHLDNERYRNLGGRPHSNFAPAVSEPLADEEAERSSVHPIQNWRRDQLRRERRWARGLALTHRIVSWVSANLFDHFTYTVRNGLNQGLRRKGGLGWLPMERETPESRFWKSSDLRGKVVYDVGAFHGLLTIHYARDARAVVAWEPNSRNRRRLMENVNLNLFSNVTVRSYGLSSKVARAEMRFDPSMPGMATVDSGVASGSEHETIELRTLDGEQGLEPPDLIKIDVEGFELEVLKGAARTLERGPELFLEMHGADAEDKRRRVGAIVDHLWALGYRRIFHVETAIEVTPDNSALASQGHLYARAEWA